MLHVVLVGPRPAGSLRWQGLHPNGAGSQGVQGMSTCLPQQGRDMCLLRAGGTGRPWNHAEGSRALVLILASENLWACDHTAFCPGAIFQDVSAS